MEYGGEDGRMEGSAGSMNREQRRDSSQQRSSSSSRVARRREPRAASGIQSDKRANWTVRGRGREGGRWWKKRRES